MLARSWHKPFRIKPNQRMDNSRHFIMLDQPAAFRNAVDAFVSANAGKT